MRSNTGHSKSPMKKLFALLAFVVAQFSAFATTNLIVVGGTPSHNFTDSSDWQTVVVVYLLPAISILAGIIQLLFPRVAWYLKMFGKRWEFSGDVEPSDWWLIFARIGGLLLIAAGIFLNVSIHNGGKFLPH
jgi:hypothetical protein